MNENLKKQRIVRNSILLYARMLLTTFIGLYASRALLKGLGFEDYGLYNVVGGLVMLISFVKQSLGNATWRYITVSLGKGDTHEVNRVFNVALQLHGLFCVLLVVVAESIGLWFLYHKMNIPLGKELDTLIVYQLSTVVIVLTILSSPYISLILAHERMDAFAYITIFESVGKLISAIALFWLTAHHLTLYAVFILLVQVCVNLLYWFYCFRHFKESRLRMVKAPAMMKEMTGFAGFTLLPGLGFACCDQGLNILLNMFFGPTVNAARGISMQVRHLLSRFTESFLQAVSPQITKSYASGNYNYMYELVSKTAKYCYFIMLLMVVPLVLGMPVVLSFWLGEYPEYSVEFCCFVLAIGMLETVAYPFLVGAAANGRIRRYYSITGVLLVSVVPSAYLFLKLHYPPITVYVVHFCFSVAILVVRVIIGARLFGYQLRMLYSDVLVPAVRVSIPVLGMACACYLLVDLSQPLFAVSSMIVSALAISLVVLALGLNGVERHFLKVKLHDSFDKLSHKNG